MANRNFSRTLEALAAYDVHDRTFSVQNLPDDWFEQEALLGRAVGRAYGLDTADVNRVESCEHPIRPGRAVPAPGAELSFVRQRVLWHDPNIPPIPEETRSSAG